MRSTHLLLSIGMIAACGGGGGDPADPDAARAIDAWIIVDDQLPEEPVTLRAYVDAAPVVGATVIFLDPTDEVLSETTTDETGTATGDIGGGGNVVLIVDDSTPTPLVHAYLDVQPGAVLEFGRVVGAATAASVTVPAQDGATQYLVTTSCGLGASSTPVVDVVLCGDADDVYVQATSGATLLGALYAADVAAAPTITVPGTYAGTRQVTITATGVPATATSVDFIGALHGETVPYVFGTLFNQPGNTATVTVPDVAGSALGWETLIAFSGHPSQAVFSNRPVAADVTVDLGAQLLPDLSAISFDVDGRTISWSADGAGVDHVLASVRATRLGGGGGLEWHFSRAGGATTLHVPHLPASHEAANFLSTDALEIDVSGVRVTDPAAAARLATAPFEPATLVFRGYPDDVDLTTETVTATQN
jgi:hypothetical protein